MAKKKQKKKKKMPEQAPRPKNFLDMIAPAAVKFNTDHFILGSPLGGRQKQAALADS